MFCGPEGGEGREHILGKTIKKGGARMGDTAIECRRGHPAVKKEDEQEHEESPAFGRQHCVL